MSTKEIQNFANVPHKVTFRLSERDEARLRALCERAGGIRKRSAIARYALTRYLDDVEADLGTKD